MIALGLIVITLALAVIFATLGSITERKVSEADLFLARLNPDRPGGNLP